MTVNYDPFSNHKIDPYRRCETGCTHDLALGVETEELLEGDGPHVQGFGWNAESEAAIRAAGDWHTKIQARLLKPLFWQGN